jgi:transposase
MSMKNTPKNQKQAKIWIGIDVSKLELEIHSFDPAIKFPAMVPNTSSGLKTLERIITKLPLSQLIFESTGGYEKALLDHFNNLEIACTRLNPSHSRNFAESQRVTC